MKWEWMNFLGGPTISFKFNVPLNDKIKQYQCGNIFLQFLNKNIHIIWKAESKAFECSGLCAGSFKQAFYFLLFLWHGIRLLCKYNTASMYGRCYSSPPFTKEQDPFPSPPAPQRLTILFKSGSAASGTMKNPWILLFKSGQHQDQQIRFPSSKIMPGPSQPASCHGEDHLGGLQVSNLPPFFNLTPIVPDRELWRSHLPWASY